MRLLALDLGTTTGWAMSGVTPTGKLQTQSSSQSFKPGRFDGGGMRYLRMRAWLDEMHRLSPFDRLAFEEVRRHLGVDAAHAYGGFLATLTAWCEEHAIPYEGVPVGTIKKHLTGNGAASKELMITKIKALGYSPKDDNEADALALLHWMIDNETSRIAVQRPAPDIKTRGRVQMGAVSVVAAASDERRLEVDRVPGRPDRRKGSSPSSIDKSAGGGRRRAVLVRR